MTDSDHRPTGAGRAPSPAPDASRLETWIAVGEYEGQHFEVKSDLDLGTRSQTTEAMKDLTSMGNGGGGTVVFGVAERKTNGLSRADHLTPLTDRSMLTRLADIVADSVRPSLAWSTTVVDVDDGYVLIADIERSPLGPYMVENLKEFRYAIRIGDRTMPMPEQLVRDAYAEAAVRRDKLDERWRDAHLPVGTARPDWPHLTTSAMPEIDDDSYYDPAKMDPADLPYPAGEHAGIAGIASLADSLRPWADGFIATGDARCAADVAFHPDQPQATMRLHRNGAVGHGLLLGTGSEVDVLRSLNAHLTHVGDHWHHIGIRAGTVRIRLAGLGPRPSNLRTPPLPDPSRERGEPYARIELELETRTATLRSAPARHQLVRAFANRLANLYGRRRATLGFTVGRLYQNGRATELIAYPGRLHWTGIAHSQDLMICTDNAVRRAEVTDAIGFFTDGLLIDLNGNALAAVEFCTAWGLPDDYIPGDLDTDPIEEPDNRHRETPSPDNPPAPEATRCWNDTNIEDLVHSHRNT